MSHHGQQQYHQQQQGGRGAGGSSRSRGSNAAASQQQQRQSHRPTAPVSTRPTPQPSLRESSLSLTSLRQTQQALAAHHATTPQAAGPHLAPLVGPRVQDMIHAIDPKFGIDSEAQEQVLQLADDFMDKLMRQSLRLS